MGDSLSWLINPPSGGMIDQPREYSVSLKKPGVNLHVYWEYIHYMYNQLAERVKQLTYSQSVYITQMDSNNSGRQLHRVENEPHANAMNMFKTEILVSA